MNSDNTGMDITGERVHTDKKKKNRKMIISFFYICRFKGER